MSQNKDVNTTATQKSINPTIFFNNRNLLKKSKRCNPHTKGVYKRYKQLLSKVGRRIKSLLIKAKNVKV